MTPLSCAAVLGQLEAFHDDELPVDRSIAVSSHLDSCESCGAALAEIEAVGLALRGAAPGRVPLPCDEAAAHASAIVNRLKVESDASFAMRIRELFDDRHVLYAGLGAAGATIACLVIMLGMMRFGTRERSDSLAGMMSVLSAPGVEEHPVVIRPIVMDTPVMIASAVYSTLSTDEADDAVLAVSGVVTSEGRVANVALLDSNGRDDAFLTPSDTKRFARLLNTVSRTRFEPVMREGAPVAVNMVWFVTQTTVRVKERGPIRVVNRALARKQVV